MNPYVITTTTPCADCKLCDRHLTAGGTRGSVDCPHRDEIRCAVATPDAARNAITSYIAEHKREPHRPWRVFLASARDLPESGGTIGPLPDGTMIELERVEWTTLRKAIIDAGDVGTYANGQEVIDAYNAAHA